MGATTDPTREAAAVFAGARLADHYRRVHDAMRDLPICNPMLDIEAIGFRPYGDYALGVVLTPWFMNLTVCAAGAEELPPQPLGDTAHWPLPAGRVGFIVGRLEGFGRVDSCSLFSPMDDFADHAAARAVAIAALDELFESGSSDRREDDGRKRAMLDRRALLFGARRDVSDVAP